MDMVKFSSRVPAVWTYVCDGGNKEYELDRFILKFKRTTNKEVTRLSPKTALIIKVVRTLGRKVKNETEYFYSGNKAKLQ